MGVSASKDKESSQQTMKKGNERTKGDVLADDKSTTNSPSVSHSAAQGVGTPGTVSKKAAAVDPSKQRQGIDAVPELRPLREDCFSPAHNKRFSPWKVLVEGDDWQKYKQGAEGAQRYRSENLPSDYFGPGIYELAIRPPQKTTPENDNPSSCFPMLTRAKAARPLEDIIVVYVGKADNIRTRLQQHARGASHLEGHVPEAKASPSKDRSPAGKLVAVDADASPAQAGGGPVALGLFTQVFARGGSIMFRWMAVESKEAALSEESALLREFDYAWNRMENGMRRLPDIDRKLDGPEKEKWEKTSTWRHWLCVNAGRKKTRRRSSAKGAGRGGTKVVVAGSKQVHKIRAGKGSGGDRQRSSGVKGGVTSVVAVNDQGKVTPPPVKAKLDAGVQDRSRSPQTCGIATDSGPCREAPMAGRKRCPTHKGRRLRVAGGVA